MNFAKEQKLRKIRKIEDIMERKFPKTTLSSDEKNWDEKLGNKLVMFSTCGAGYHKRRTGSKIL